MYKYLKFFEDLRLEDIPQVGGKNASLGEMYHYLSPKGVNLPNGVATTADAYRYFLREAGLNEKIEAALKGLDVTNMRELKKCGNKIRTMIVKAKLPKDFEDEILRAYRELSTKCGHSKPDLTVAIRSS